ncbi:hypothetical protein [Alcanivorax sp.]|nr:hypothetical protein [Alcanivorax sp.]
MSAPSVNVANAMPSDIGTIQRKKVSRASVAIHDLTETRLFPGGIRLKV